MHPHPEPLIVQPGPGTDLHAFGNILTVMLSGEQTSGALSLMSEVTPPGGGPPLHTHSREDEIFIVIEGSIRDFTAGQWTEVGPDGVVYLPHGTEHTYRNVGTTPSRHWIITAPSGFESFFAACAAEFARSGGPVEDRILDIHHEHGIELLKVTP
jgi:mannose-6-phosphate isomerase-like protein (cupin superfamily)